MKNEVSHSYKAIGMTIKIQTRTELKKLNQNFSRNLHSASGIMVILIQHSYRLITESIQ